VSTVTGDDPEVVATGSSPAISPDGTHLAYLHGSTQIVVRDLATDQEQSFTGAPAADDTVQDVAFTADSKALVFTAAPPDGPASLYYLDLSTVATIASLNDAAQLGPAGDAPAGTHWSTPDARATDHTIGVVASCCALDANSDASFAFVNPDTGLQPASVPVEGVSGTVLRASYDHSGQNQLVLTVDGGTYSLYQRQDGPLQRLDQAAQYTAVDW
jgi:hypothetical protein